MLGGGIDADVDGERAAGEEAAEVAKTEENGVLSASRVKVLSVMSASALVMMFIDCSRLLEKRQKGKKSNEEIITAHDTCKKKKNEHTQVSINHPFQTEPMASTVKCIYNFSALTHSNTHIYTRANQCVSSCATGASAK